MGQVDTAADETRSFMKTRVILTAAELDFFTRLDEKPCNASELAREKELNVWATTRVLDCLVALGLLEKKDGAYKPTESGSLYSARHPQTIRPMVLHMNHLWDIWSELTDVVKKVEILEGAQVSRWIMRAGSRSSAPSAGSLRKN